MPANDTLLFCVVHPAVATFYPEYVRSIEAQDDLCFDLLLVDDHAGCAARPSIEGSVETLRLTTTPTPAAIRAMGVSYAIERGYRRLVFSDADDTFSASRLAASKAGLENDEAVFNEITLVDAQGRVLEPDVLQRLGAPETCADAAGIADRNIFGLGNTAACCDALRRCRIEIPDDVVAVDWFLFTVLLLNGVRLRFVPRAMTYYRQHGSNTVGMARLLDERRLRFGIEVKLRHYGGVAAYCDRRGFGPQGRFYGQKADEMVRLRAALEDDARRARYLGFVNDNLSELYRGWWSEIVSLDTWSRSERELL